jgi:hypothetical protein
MQPANRLIVAYSLVYRRPLIKMHPTKVQDATGCMISRGNKFLHLENQFKIVEKNRLFELKNRLKETIWTHK